ncbi:hypothetical protein C5L31_001052 [Secundilactobacillus malefermentans]|uniref:Uncharacterized protein n=1 Tax=Secundilactobacillus malefermentans TaxID=176292 RepID=A0A4R5NKL0_9LACO|nr:hypothetical protein C5L31_001052 [Secundilactobacillus malefermentans]
MRKKRPNAEKNAKVKKAFIFKLRILLNWESAFFQVHRNPEKTFSQLLEFSLFLAYYEVETGKIL